MEELFSDCPEVLENTVKIAKKCDVELTMGTFFFPRVILPKGKIDAEVLKEKSQKGLVTRYKKVTKELLARLNYELKVINDKIRCNLL